MGLWGKYIQHATFVCKLMLAGNIALVFSGFFLSAFHLNAEDMLAVAI